MIADKIASETCKESAIRVGVGMIGVVRKKEGTTGEALRCGNDTRATILLKSKYCRRRNLFEENHITLFSPPLSRRQNLALGFEREVQRERGIDSTLDWAQLPQS